MLKDIIPRFTTEYVACIDKGDYYETGFPMSKWDESVDGVPDAVLPVKCLIFFGFSLFPKADGCMMSYQEYKEDI